MEGSHGGASVLKGMQNQLQIVETKRARRKGSLQEHQRCSKEENKKADCLEQMQWTAMENHTPHC